MSNSSATSHNATHTAKRIEQIEVHTRLDLLVFFHSTHSCSYILVYISWVSLGIVSIFFGSFGGIRLPTPPTRKTIGNAISTATITKHATAKTHIRLHPSIRKIYGLHTKFYLKFTQLFHLCKFHAQPSICLRILSATSSVRSYMSRDAMDEYAPNT